MKFTRYCRTFLFFTKFCLNRLLGKNKNILLSEERVVRCGDTVEVQPSIKVLTRSVEAVVADLHVHLEGGLRTVPATEHGTISNCSRTTGTAAELHIQLHVESHSGG